MKRLLTGAAVLAFILSSAPSAFAIPILQLYIEGASYDDTSETWVLPGGGTTIRLWTIGNVDGPGGAGAVDDVRLSVAYSAGATPTFALFATGIAAAVSRVRARRNRIRV